MWKRCVECVCVCGVGWGGGDVNLNSSINKIHSYLFDVDGWSWQDNFFEQLILILNSLSQYLNQTGYTEGGGVGEHNVIG